MSRCYVGDCGVAHEPGRHYPGRDWLVFTGWGETWCVASERGVDLARSRALLSRGFGGMAIMAQSESRNDFPLAPPTLDRS